MRYTNAALPSRPWFCEHRNTITTYVRVRPCVYSVQTSDGRPDASGEGCRARGQAQGASPSARVTTQIWRAGFWGKARLLCMCPPRAFQYLRHSTDFSSHI